MHILFLTDNFPPEVNAPASRTFEHCREWVKAGNQVTVITCVPNFPKGQIYSGYRHWPWQSEVMDGIRVTRVWSYITANEGLFRRTLDYMSFMLSAVLAAPFVRKVDLIIGTSPQFFTVCAAFAVSRTKRVPFVFELRDLWPESIRAVGALRNARLLALLEAIELFLYRKATRIVANSSAFKGNLAKRGIDPSKIEVITNGVDLKRFRAQPKDPHLVERFGLQGKFVAGYVGTHGMAHALETLLDAAQRLAGERFHLILLGDGARKRELEEKARAMRLENVTFIDSVPKEEVVRYWSLLDVAIIHLRKTELFTTVIPSKLFEAMAMGVPVVHAVKGESADIVRREGVGITCEPEDADELATALIHLESNPALYQGLRSACTTAATRYSRAALAREMLGILEGMLEQPRRRQTPR